MGLDKNSYDLIGLHLSSRRQGIRTGLGFSSPYPAKFYVPQGSVLGPVLLLYMLLCSISWRIWLLPLVPMRQRWWVWCEQRWWGSYSNFLSVNVHNVYLDDTLSWFQHTNEALVKVTEKRFIPSTHTHICMYIRVLLFWETFFLSSLKIL